MHLLTDIPFIGPLLRADTVAADTTAWSARLAEATQHAPTAKFWVVQDFSQWLAGLGLSPWWCDALAFVVVCAGLALTVWFIDRVLLRLGLTFIRRWAKHSRRALVGILFQRKFYRRALYLIPLGVILFSINTFFSGFTPGLNETVRIATRCAVFFTVMLVCFSLLDALNDLYQRRPEAQLRSIKGYVQVGKILVAFIVAILIVAALLQESPARLFVGLGAAAAVLSLIFRDTLLDFVASIQLAAQDMLRPGDWIEMPGKQANGVVLDINLNSVKVQNWDNTVTTIPIYSMVSESFINWRCMEQSTGRRFTCRFRLDVTSIARADDALLQRIAADPLTQSESQAAIELARSSSPHYLTNLALFRAHMEVWLFRHPQLNPRLLTFARHLTEVTETGLVFEVYAFTRNTESEYAYDTVRRSTMEYVMACLPLFGLRMFQRPSGLDVDEIGRDDRQPGSKTS